MDFYQKDGVIIRVAEESEKAKKKKGDGVSAAIGLLQEMRNFQEKVEACIESQDIAENKQKIQDILTGLETGYQSLIDIASSGIRSMGKNPESVIGGNTEASPETSNEMEVKEDKPKQDGPTLPSTPSIPKISKL